MTAVDQEVTKVSKAEVRRALKTVCPDDLPVEVWKSPVDVAIEFLYCF